MGVPLEEIIKRTTTNPARVIGKAGRLGTLKPGAIADVAAFVSERGSFEFRDPDGDTMHGDQRLVCRLTREGREDLVAGEPVRRFSTSSSRLFRTGEKQVLTERHLWIRLIGRPTSLELRGGPP
jgi:predicted amidohydrolase